MKSKVYLGFLCFVVFALIGGCCCNKPPHIASVDLTLVPQHTNTWCWAACTEGVSAFYGHTVLQCESSKYVHSNPSTCTDCPTYCSCWNVCGATISQIKDNWTHWKFKYTYLDSCLSFNDIKNIIYCEKSPIYSIWWWYGGGGHVVNIYAYAEVGTQSFVSYMNPWPPDCSGPGSKCNTSVSGGEDAVSSYADFVDDGSHRWGNSFYIFLYQ